MDALLECKDVCYFSNGKAVLNKASLKVMPRELHVIIGSNGAGKTMLMKCCAGRQQYDAGNIFLDGEKVAFKSAKDALLANIYMITSEISLLPNLSVLENIFMKHWIRKKGFIDWKKQADIAKKIFCDFGLSIDINVQAGKLGMAEQRTVEIVKALIWRAKVLIIDEAFAEFTDSEMQRAMRVLMQVKEHDCSVLVVTQRYWATYDMADAVSVMNAGKVEITTKEKQKFSSVIEICARGPKMKKAIFEYRPHSKIVFEAQSIADHYSIRNASFCVREGEVVGITGRMGSGRTCLAKLMAGVNRAKKGKMFMEGKELVFDRSRLFTKSGIAYLPENDSLALNDLFVLTKNITLGNLRQVTTGGIIDLNQEENIANQYCKKFGLRYFSGAVLPDQLSAGERKKVLWSKNVMAQSKLFVLDEPTKNLDYASKVDVYNFIYSLVLKGKSVVMLTSNYEELIGMCSSVLILRDGVIVEELRGKSLTEGNIQHCIYGHDEG